MKHNNLIWKTAALTTSFMFVTSAQAMKIDHGSDFLGHGYSKAPEHSRAWDRHHSDVAIKHCLDKGYNSNWRHSPAYTEGEVVFENVTFGFGESTDIRKLHLKEDGYYKISLNDFAFPDPFETLSLIVTSASKTYARLDSEGEMVFEALAGNLFFSSYYVNDDKAPGLYGYELTYMGQYSSPTAVPLPGAFWLFASGLAGLGIMRRRQSS